MLEPHFRRRAKVARDKTSFGESLRGKWIGATGLRASEKEICLWEGLWEGGFSEVFRGFQRFLEVSRGFQRFFRGFQSSSQRPSQRQISLSEALSLVAPIVLLLELSPMVFKLRAFFRRNAPTFLQEFWALFWGGDQKTWVLQGGEPRVAQFYLKWYIGGSKIL